MVQCAIIVARGWCTFGTLVLSWVPLFSVQNLMAPRPAAQSQHQLGMGRPFTADHPEDSTGPPIGDAEQRYACLSCEAELATATHLRWCGCLPESRWAFLFTQTTSSVVVTSQPHELSLPIGQCIVEDLGCRDCSTFLGWRFVELLDSFASEHWALPCVGESLILQATLRLLASRNSLHAARQLIQSTADSATMNPDLSARLAGASRAGGGPSNQRAYHPQQHQGPGAASYVLAHEMGEAVLCLRYDQQLLEADALTQVQNVTLLGPHHLGPHSAPALHYPELLVTPTFQYNAGHVFSQPSVQPQGLMSHAMQSQLVGQSLQPQLVGQPAQSQLVGQSLQPQRVGQPAQSQLVGQSLQHQLVGQPAQPQLVSQSLQPQLAGQAVPSQYVRPSTARMPWPPAAAPRASLEGDVASTIKEHMLNLLFPDDQARNDLTQQQLRELQLQQTQQVMYTDGAHLYEYDPGQLPHLHTSQPGPTAGMTPAQAWQHDYPHVPHSMTAYPELLVTDHQDMWPYVQQQQQQQMRAQQQQQQMRAQQQQQQMHAQQQQQQMHAQQQQQMRGFRLLPGQQLANINVDWDPHAPPPELRVQAPPNNNLRQMIQTAGLDGLLQLVYALGGPAAMLGSAPSADQIRAAQALQSALSTYQSPPLQPPARAQSLPEVKLTAGPTSQDSVHLDTPPALHTPPPGAAPLAAPTAVTLPSMAMPAVPRGPPRMAAAPGDRLPISAIIMAQQSAAAAAAAGAIPAPQLQAPPPPPPVRIVPPQQTPVLRGARLPVRHTNPQQSTPPARAANNLVTAIIDRAARHAQTAGIAPMSSRASNLTNSGLRAMLGGVPVLRPPVKSFKVTAIPGPSSSSLVRRVPTARAQPSAAHPSTSTTSPGSNSTSSSSRARSARKSLVGSLVHMFSPLTNVKPVTIVGPNLFLSKKQDEEGKEEKEQPADQAMKYRVMWPSAQRPKRIEQCVLECEHAASMVWLQMATGKQTTGRFVPGGTWRPAAQAEPDTAEAKAAMVEADDADATEAQAQVDEQEEGDVGSSSADVSPATSCDSLHGLELSGAAQQTVGPGEGVQEEEGAAVPPAKELPPNCLRAVLLRMNDNKGLVV